MDVVSILRQLWRHRLPVAVGVALALTVGLLMAYRVGAGLPPTFESRQYAVGVASAEVLVDSPSSQIADLGGGKVRADVAALTARARLLASLMAASPLKDDIARTAGIDPRTFVATAPSSDPSLRPPTLEQSPGPRANSLTVFYNEAVPIITADAQAVDEHVAARISSAAVAVLGKYLTSVAALDKVPDARQLVIDPLGPARSATVVRGPGTLLAVLAFAVVLGLWCAGVVVAARLARGWREAVAGDAPASLPMAAQEPADAAPEPPRPARGMVA